jgi:hypothetical protein
MINSPEWRKSEEKLFPNKTMFDYIYLWLQSLHGTPPAFRACCNDANSIKFSVLSFGQLDL